MSPLQFKLFTFRVLEELRARGPRDTGNLLENGFQMEQVSVDIFKITWDESIAPYMVYLNEGTGNSQKHVKWFEKLVPEIIRNQTRIMQGVLKEYG